MDMMTESIKGSLCNFVTMKVMNILEVWGGYGICL